MKKKKFIFGILTVAIVIIITYLCSLGVQNYEIEKLSGASKGTPEYAIAEQNYLVGINIIKSNYVIDDDYLFNVCITDQRKGLSRVGVLTKSGEYSFTELGTPKAVIPLSQEIVYAIRVYTNKGNIIFDYDLGVGLVAENQYDLFGIKKVDGADVELHDQNGNALDKISIAGYLYAAFFDIRQDIEDDFAIYAKYGSEETLVIDAESIKAQIS